jgi:SAM-dependent methyltransferase
MATASIAHAFSVWVVQAVANPPALFEECARVLRPGGRYVVCGTQWAANDDEMGQIMAKLAERIDIRRNAPRRRRVTAEEVLGWARPAGFVGSVQHVEPQWHGTPAEELLAIDHRVWATLRELDERAIREVTQPTIESLSSLPQTQHLRRAIADVIVLDRQG